MKKNRRMVLAITLAAIGLFSLPAAVHYVKQLSKDSIERLTGCFQAVDVSTVKRSELIACSNKCFEGDPES